MMKKYRKKKQCNGFEKCIKTLQWGYYKGGLPLMFIVLGMILILLFPVLFTVLQLWSSILIVLGLLFVAGGVYLQYFYKK